MTQVSTPGIDLDRALLRVGGNRALLNAVLASFHESYQGLDERLHRLAANDDWESLRLLCHTLKGSAGNIAAENLSHCAAEIETQIKHDFLPVPAVLLRQCISAWEELAPTLVSLLAQSGNEEGVCLTATELMLRLSRIRTLIDSDFAAADSEFLAMRNASVPEQYQSDFELFVRQFDAFDMHDAKTSISRMMGRNSDE